MDKTTDSSSSHQTTSANAATAGNHGGGTPDFGGGGDTPPQTHHVVNSNDNISVGCGPSSTNINNIGKQTVAAVGNSGGVGSCSAITSANGSIVSASTSTSTPSSSSTVVASHSQRSITNGAHHHQHHHHISLLGAHNVTTLQHTAPPHAVPHPLINLNISTTTGGNFGVTVDPQISVENLKKIISKKLKVAKDRICLLHREKELQDGTLKDNNLMDGSKIILIPNVETGLLAQRPENTVMQALESLNDSQVNDFLSGKTPLNLSMRLGDHMMLIQLQLSTVNPVNSSNSVNGGTNCSSSSLRTRSGQRSSSSRTAASSTTPAAGGGSAAVAAAHHNHHHHHHHHHHHASAASNTAAGATTATARKIDSRIATGGGATSSATSASISTTTAIKSSDLSSFLSKRDYESLQNIVKSIAMAQPARLAAAAAASSAMNATAMPVVITQLQQQQPQQQQQTTNSTITHTPAVVCPPPTILTATANNTHQTLRTTMPSTASNTVSTTAFHAATEAAVTGDIATAASSDAAALLEQSPIKSLSNLVSSPIKTTAIKNIPIANGKGNCCSTTASCSTISSAALVATSVGSSAAAATSPIQTAGAALSKVAAAPAATCQDPIAAKLTSCLCTRLNATGGVAAVNKVAAKRCIESLCLSRQEKNMPIVHSRTSTTPMSITSSPNYKVGAVQPPTGAAAESSSCTALLHKTTNNPISRSKHRHHHHHHHHHHHYHHHGGGSGTCGSAVSSNSCNSGASTALQRPPTSKQLVAAAGTVARCSTSASNDSGFASDDSALTSNGAASSTSTAASTFTTSASSTTATTEPEDSGIASSDTRTLAEASRNLTQTLRKLSKEVFTNKIDLSGVDDNSRKSGSGAVIESMKNHGKGIYSGTFSGTLNPALQDRYGRPKRDISTVIHILNDLLSATPQYSRGARISFEAPSTSSAAAAAASSAAGTTASGAITSHGSRSKQISSKHHQHSHSCVKCVKTSHTHTTVSHHSGACAYGECNGHYVKTKSNYACCQDLTTTTSTGASSNATTSSASSSSSTSNASTNTNDRNTCVCRYRIIDETTGEREREHTCQKCLVDMDNSKTKSKLDQLRLVMQQRKQKREARKLKGAPYGARVVGATAATSTASVTTAAANNTNASTPMDITPAASSSSTAATTTPLNSGSSTLATPNDVSPNHIVEEVDTAA